MRQMMQIPENPNGNNNPNEINHLYNEYFNNNQTNNNSIYCYVSTINGFVNLLMAGPAVR